MNVQRGFTLIELMIVVAIIGVLAAIAIPSYNDYTTRSQVSESMILLGGLKNDIVSYYSESGEIPSMADLDTYGGGSQVTSGKYVSTITQEGSNEYVAYMKTTGIQPSVANKTIKLIYKTVDRKFDCTIGTMPAKYAPSACK